MRLLVLSLVAGPLLAGCASKKFVGREVGEVNEKLTALSADVERTQERTKKNEGRIDEVGQKADAGVSEAKGSARDAMNRATDAERAAKGKLVYSLTLSNDKVTFPFDRAQLSDDAKLMVDDAIGPLVGENRGVFLEIEGHTDSTGPEPYNHRLGYDRALAVRDYLHDQHKVALT